MPGTDSSFFTGRLRLREWTLEDRPFLDELYGDPEVMRYIGDGLPRTPEQIDKGLRATIRRYWRDRMGMWCVEERESGRILGHCGLQRWEGTTDTEVGYLLRRDARGRGYATEAAHEALRYGFTEFRLHRIVAVAHPENAASIAVMERLGMTSHGTTEYKGKEGVVLYAVSREDYFASRRSQDSTPK